MSRIDHGIIIRNVSYTNTLDYKNKKMGFYRVDQTCIYNQTCQ